MTHKSRIYAPIETHPLPDYDCKIDVKLECGSVLIGCRHYCGLHNGNAGNYIWFDNVKNYSTCINQSKIKSWRLSK